MSTQPETFVLNVTQRDIERATPGTFNHPVAVAIHRTIKSGSIDVALSGAGVDFYDDKRRLLREFAIKWPLGIAMMCERWLKGERSFWKPDSIICVVKSEHVGDFGKWCLI